MAKSPTNRTSSNAWKEVVYNKCNKAKAKMASKLAQAKGKKEQKNEEFKSVTVKKEEMTKAMTKGNQTPKRKRDPSTELIILSNDSETKMDIDNETKLNEEFLEVESSKEDSVLKKLPATKKKKGHGFVNFMIDLDSDDEDEDMFSVENDQDTKEEENETTNEDIVKLDEKSNKRDAHK